MNISAKLMPYASIDAEAGDTYFEKKHLCKAMNISTVLSKFMMPFPKTSHRLLPFTLTRRATTRCQLGNYVRSNRWAAVAFPFPLLWTRLSPSRHLLRPSPRCNLFCSTSTVPTSPSLKLLKRILTVLSPRMPATSRPVNVPLPFFSL
jgi:hypothetical protein